MDEFDREVKAILERKSRSKGYDGGYGQLWKLCRELPHPLGEIIYKVIRYHRKGIPEDLVKIAGWAKLVWEERMGYYGNKPRNNGRGGKSKPGARASTIRPRPSQHHPNRGGRRGSKGGKRTHAPTPVQSFGGRG